MATAATLKKRYGKFSEGPYMKEVVVVEIVDDYDDINFVNILMADPAYVRISPVNYDAPVDTASAYLESGRVMITHAMVGRSYLVEVIGF